MCAMCPFFFFLYRLPFCLYPFFSFFLLFLFPSSTGTKITKKINKNYLKLKICHVHVSHSSKHPQTYHFVIYASLFFVIVGCALWVLCFCSGLQEPHDTLINRTWAKH